MIHRSFLSFAGALLALLALAAAAAAEDHPLVSAYPGSKPIKREVRASDRYRLVVGLDIKTMNFETLELEGKLTRLVYTNPAGRSPLEIFRHYRQALEGSSAQFLYGCELEACGAPSARSRWSQHNGLFVASEGDPRYLAAQLGSKGSAAFVAVMVGRQRTQVDIVE